MVIAYQDDLAKIATSFNGEIAVDYLKNTNPLMHAINQYGYSNFCRVDVGCQNMGSTTFKTSANPLGVFKCYDRDNGKPVCEINISPDTYPTISDKNYLYVQIGDIKIKMKAASTTYTNVTIGGVLQSSIQKYYRVNIGVDENAEELMQIFKSSVGSKLEFSVSW